MFRHWLVRDIALVIAVKVAVIFAAAHFVFGAKQLPVIDEQAMQERLIVGTPAPGKERGL